MNIGRLNEWVTIQKQCVSSAVAGDKPLSNRLSNRTSEWVNIHQCHATVGGESGGMSTEVEAAGVTVDHTDLEVTIRDCQAVREVTNSGYRVIFKGDIYDIKMVDHAYYRHEWIKLKCKKVMR